jgi:hypothetical protein
MTPTRKKSFSIGGFVAQPKTLQGDRLGPSVNGQVSTGKSCWKRRKP